MGGGGCVHSIEQGVLCNKVIVYGLLFFFSVYHYEEVFFHGEKSNVAKIQLLTTYSYNQMLTFSHN